MRSEKEELLIKSVKGGKGVKKMSTADVINFLKINNIDLISNDTHGYNLLHYAIKSENFELVQLFLTLDEENYLTMKADPNRRTSDAQKSLYVSPLLLTLLSCNDSSICSKILKCLIKLGGDINSKDEDGCNLYLRCAEKGKLEVLDYLFNIDNISVNVNETCCSGSALHMAIIGEQEELIPFLLEKKIDLTLQDNNGNTALHLALELRMNNSFKLIQDFIIGNKEFTPEYKKRIFNAQNDEGNTILHVLAYAKCGFLVEMIKKYPQELAVDLEIKNKQGYTYKGVQENIVKLQKEKEEKEKLYKETVRKEKERIAKEKQEELIREKEQMEKFIAAEESKKKLGEIMIKYRAIIFGIVLIILLLILYFVISKAASRKKVIVL